MVCACDRGDRLKIKLRSPACVHNWTSIYYGPKGAGKSLHSARELLTLIRYLNKLYNKFPKLHRAIIVTNHKLAAELERLYLGREIFYFDDNNIETLRYCPRKGCWRGPQPHKLHACYLFIDDVSTFCPATDWPTFPQWFKKLMIKGRKLSVHIVATCIDPFDVVLPIRRATDRCYKFQTIWKTRDPDETQPALKHIFGWYHRRRITAEMLWKYGDLPEQMIQLRKIQQEELHERMREMEKAYAIVYDDSWAGSTHFFNRSGRFPNWRWLRGLRVSSTDTYDTLQDIAAED